MGKCLSHNTFLAIYNGNDFIYGLLKAFKINYVILELHEFNLYKIFLGVL